MKKRVYKLIERTSVGHRIICDRRFRVFIFTGASLGLNIIYGIYNGALGAVYGSTWFGTLCAYYLVLGAMRFSVMPHSLKKINEYTLMRLNGIVFIFLSILLAVIVFISLSYSVQISYNTVAMISIAAYTFCVAVFAIKNFIKAHKGKSPYMITVRNISFVAAVASVMSLERSMVSTFSDRSTEFGVVMDACVGAGGFLIVLIIGISMITMSNNRGHNGGLKKTKNSKIGL